MATKITSKQRVSLYITPTDAAGNPVILPSVEWMSSHPAIVEVIPSPDTQSALAFAKAVGAATVTATVGTMSSTIDLEVVLPEAVSFTVQAGTPSPL